MPYITAEEVKVIRQELKKALPEYKLSVTRYHHSTVCVVIMEGPLDFGGDNMTINHFWYKDHFKENPAAVEVFDKIMNTIGEKKKSEIIVHDSDYGAVPNYYINLEIGKWDKKYQRKA